MGLFGKLFGKQSGPEAIKAQELNPAERRLMDGHRAAFGRFKQQASVNGDPISEAPRIGDELLAWWHAQPETSRPDANDLVWAIGTAIGDYLGPKTNTHWMVVTDPFGTSMSLFAASTGQYTQLVLAPVDSVAKRFESAFPGDLQRYAEATIAEIEKMRRS